MWQEGAAPPPPDPNMRSGWTLEEVAAVEKTSESQVDPVLYPSAVPVVETDIEMEEPPEEPPIEPPEIEDTKNRKELETKKKKQPLISQPPELPSDLGQAALQQLREQQGEQGHIVLDVQEQRDLKKELDETAKEKAEQKKEEAMKKQQNAAQVALEKAQKKLEQAKAKAEQVQNKMTGRTKRKLDKEFARVDDLGGPPTSPAQPARRTAEAKRAEAKGKAKPSPNKKKVKLSPKAKLFASKSREALNTTSTPSKAAKNRQAKAEHALLLLHDLETPLVGLQLPPPTFTKKILGCIHVILQQYTCTYSNQR